MTGRNNGISFQSPSDGKGLAYGVGLCLISHRIWEFGLR
jgi:hypothetical protein